MEKNQQANLTKDQIIALRGLRVPGTMLRRLQRAGIRCDPAVAIEYQSNAHRYVLHGSESGGASTEVGAFCGFVGLTGTRLEWKQTYQKVGRNGLHALMIAPEFVRIHACRDGQMYWLLVTHHSLKTRLGRMRPALESQILFQGEFGMLALDLWGKDRQFSGSVLPVFYTRSGEKHLVPGRFVEVAKTVIAGTNCIGCSHWHVALPPGAVNTTIAKATPESPTHTTEFCLECRAVLPVQVCQSAAGYFIGTECENCGPHSRFSGYTREKERAEEVLNAFLRNPCKLGGYFLCDTNLTAVELLCCEKQPGEFTARYYGRDEFSMSE